MLAAPLPDQRPTRPGIQQITPAVPQKPDMSLTPIYSLHARMRRAGINPMPGKQAPAQPGTAAYRQQARQSRLDEKYGDRMAQWKEKRKAERAAKQNPMTGAGSSGPFIPETQTPPRADMSPVPTGPVAAPQTPLPIPLEGRGFEQQM